MQRNLESKSVRQLMAEADELIRQINSEALEAVEEGHRRRFEKHIQALEKIKLGQVAEMAPQDLSSKSSVAKGMHAAILDIVKAMREFKNNLAS
jgi:hypothetical protein